MGKKPFSERRGYAHFCFCLGLQSGVVIISLIWVSLGLLSFGVSIFAITHDTKTSLLHFIKTLAYTLTLKGVIVTLIGGYGFYCVTRPLVNLNRVKFYTYFVWFFMVFAWAMLAVAFVIAFVVERNKFLNQCQGCTSNATRQTVIFGVTGFLTTVLNVYFATILHAYIDRKQQKIANAKRAARFTQESDGSDESSWAKFDWAHTAQMKGEQKWADERKKAPVLPTYGAGKDDIPLPPFEKKAPVLFRYGAGTDDIPLPPFEKKAPAPANFAVDEYYIMPPPFTFTPTTTRGSSSRQSTSSQPISPDSTDYLL